MNVIETGVLRLLGRDTAAVRADAQAVPGGAGGPGGPGGLLGLPQIRPETKAPPRPSNTRDDNGGATATATPAATAVQGRGSLAVNGTSNGAPGDQARLSVRAQAWSAALQAAANLGIGAVASPRAGVRLTEALLSPDIGHDGQAALMGNSRSPAGEGMLQGRAAAGQGRANGGAVSDAAALPMSATDLADLRDAATVAAFRLQRGVELSGLFFESHLAQWAAGTRDADALRLELARRGLAPLEALPPGSGPPVAPGQPEDRLHAQLETLRLQRVVVDAPAWDGQGALIEIAREQNGSPWPAMRSPLTPHIAPHSAPHTGPSAPIDPNVAFGGGPFAPRNASAHGAAAARYQAVDDDAPPSRAHGVAPACSATLVLDLPTLGRLTVRLRVAGDSVAADVAHAQPGHIAARLHAFGEQLAARGLMPVALRALLPHALPAPQL